MLTLHPLTHHRCAWLRACLSLCHDMIASDTSSPLLPPKPTDSTPAVPSAHSIYNVYDEHPPHSLPISRLLSLLATSAATGLASSTATTRLKQYGSNSTPTRTQSFWSVFVEEVKEPLILMLLALGVLYFVWGQIEEALTVCFIIALCVLLEIAVEWKAKRALALLTHSTHQPPVLTMRSSTLVSVSPTDLVPGDVVHLNAGDQVPADGRLLQSTWLTVDESTLTGESVAVAKKEIDDGQPVDKPLRARSCMLYADSIVSQGHAVLLVTSTSSHSYTGQMRTTMRQARPPPTPLQKAMKRLAFQLTIAAAMCCAAVFALSFLLSPLSYSAIILATLSLAFASIPEELPILIKVVLAVGGMGMGKRGVLVKSLKTAESLGGVSVLLADKTGTLTENRLEVRGCWMAWMAQGDESALWMDVVECAVMSSPALMQQVRVDQSSEQVNVSGVRDRFDTALLRASAYPSTSDSAAILSSFRAQSAVLSVLSSASSHAITHLLPFDPVRKRSSCLRSSAAATSTLFCRGSSESVLSVSNWIKRVDGKVARLSEEDKQRVRKIVDALSERGMRVLSFARREVSQEQLSEVDLPSDSEEMKENSERHTAEMGAAELTSKAGNAEGGRLLLQLESELTFVGVLAFEDRIRSGVADTICQLQAAGITVKMVTGDHRRTAEAVCRQVGILPSSAPSSSAATPSDPSSVCYARQTPADKLALVTSHQSDGHIVLVTGDGFNDAMSLAHADIGLAMGEGGSDAAREAAGLILTTCHFPDVLSAIREGRRLLDNLKKAVRFYLACKLALTLLFFFSLFAFSSLPLQPLHVIVLEAFMDLGASAAFTSEAADVDVMVRRPDEWGRGRLLQGDGFWPALLTGGVAMAAGLGGVMWVGQKRLADAEVISGEEDRLRVVQTMVWLGWMVGHVLLAHAMRSLQRSILFDSLLGALRPSPTTSQSPTSSSSSPSSYSQLQLESGYAHRATPSPAVTTSDGALTVLSNPLLLLWTGSAWLVAALSVSVPGLRGVLELADVSVVVGGMPAWVWPVLVPCAMYVAVEVAKLLRSKRPS